MRDVVDVVLEQYNSCNKCSSKEEEWNLGTSGKFERAVDQYDEAYYER